MHRPLRLSERRVLLVRGGGALVRGAGALVRGAGVPVRGGLPRVRQSRLQRRWGRRQAQGSWLGSPGPGVARAQGGRTQDGRAQRRSARARSPWRAPGWSRTTRTWPSGPPRASRPRRPTRAGRWAQPRRWSPGLCGRPAFHSGRFGRDQGVLCQASIQPELVDRGVTGRPRGHGGRRFRSRRGLTLRAAASPTDPACVPGPGSVLVTASAPFTGPVAGPAQVPSTISASEERPQQGGSPRSAMLARRPPWPAPVPPPLRAAAAGSLADSPPSGVPAAS